MDRVSERRNDGCGGAHCISIADRVRLALQCTASTKLLITNLTCHATSSRGGERGCTGHTCSSGGSTSSSNGSSFQFTYIQPENRSQGDLRQPGPELLIFQIEQCHSFVRSGQESSCRESLIPRTTVQTILEAQSTPAILTIRPSHTLKENQSHVSR